MVRVWLGAGVDLDSGQTSGVSERELGDARGVEALDLLRVPDASLGALAFIDARSLAVLARTPLPAEERTSRVVADHAVHILDRARPGAHLRIPADFVSAAPGRGFEELAVVQPAVALAEVGAEGLRFEVGPTFALVVVEVDGHTQLVTVSVRAAAWQSFLDDRPAEGEVAVGLVTLTPDDLDVRSLGVSGVSSLVAGPQRALAYAVSEGGLPTQLEVARVDGTRERLTSNEWTDTLPRFFPDGRHLGFVTLVRSSLSAVPYSTARVVRVPEPQ